MPSECYCKVLKLLFVRFVLNSPAMKTFTVYVIFLSFFFFNQETLETLESFR